jgi:hypothetical protein
MKTTDPRDPFDPHLDALLASRPLQASDDFTQRVLTAAGASPAATPPPAKSTPSARRFLRYALPLAAAIALATTLLPSRPHTAPGARAVNPPAATAQPLLTAELEEILILQESLAGLMPPDGESLAASNLLHTLEALYFDFQS